MKEKETNKEIKACHNCRAENSCDNCGKPFCYGCLGRGGHDGNRLYCDPCYRQKEGLNDDDWIIKKSCVNGKGATTYSWEVKKGDDNSS